MKAIQQYIYNILVWIDEGLSTIFLGSPHETCSSRLGRHYDTSRVARICADGVNYVALHVFGQKDHCQTNIEPSDYQTGEILK
jgi:hypothetical protein